MKKYILVNPALFSVYSIVAVTAALIGMSFAFIMAALVNLVIVQSVHELYVVITAAVVWLIFNTIFRSLYLLLSNKYLKIINVKLRQDLFQKILTQDILHFNSVNTGTYMADLLNNLQSLENNYFSAILKFIYMSANLLGAFFSMLFIDFSTLYMILVLMLISAVIPRLAARYVKEKSESYIKGLDNYTARLKGFLEGFVLIRSFNLYPRMCEQHLAASEEMEYKKMSQGNLNILLSSTAVFCGLFSTIAAMGFGVYLVLMGRAEAGAVIAMGHLIGNVSSIADTVSGFLSQLNMSKPIRKRFEGILSEAYDPDTGIELKEAGDIRLEQVSFSYDRENYVLDDVSFVFEKGKKYAIIGESGCGKSSLFRLLLCFYPVARGRILVGGKEIGSLLKKSLYNKIGEVNQSVFLFPDTLYNNLTLYKEVSPEKLVKAVEQAGLTEFVNALPDGLHTCLSEGGKNLSGGERQRIAVARLLLQNTEVLLLDEFTANLDMQTSIMLEKNILKLERKTILHITHKLVPELLRKYDSILVMKGGRITECGGYEELMEKKGFFYSLNILAGL